MDQQARTAALDVETIPRGRMLWRFVRQIAFALISIVVLVVAFGVLNPRFLSGGNWFHIAQQVAVIAILATGQTFIIATAGIDISQGSVVALSSMICAIAIVDAHMSSGVAIVLTLALGAVIGASVPTNRNGCSITSAQRITSGSFRLSTRYLTGRLTAPYGRKSRRTLPIMLSTWRCISAQRRIGETSGLFRPTNHWLPHPTPSGPRIHLHEGLGGYAGKDGNRKRISIFSIKAKMGIEVPFPVTIR